MRGLQRPMAPDFQVPDARQRFDYTIVDDPIKKYAESFGGKATIEQGSTQLPLQQPLFSSRNVTFIWEEHSRLSNAAKWGFNLEKLKYDCHRTGGLGEQTSLNVAWNVPLALLSITKSVVKHRKYKLVKPDNKI